MRKSGARGFLGSLSRRTRWEVALVAMAIVLVAVAGIAFTSAGHASAVAQQTVSPAQDVAKVLGPSVVNLRVAWPSGGGAEGSGVIYTADGMIITNNHVVTDAYTGQDVSAIKVTLATGEQLDGTLVGRDPSTEIAVVKVDAGHDLPAAKFASELPTVGEYAIAIGSPLGYDNSVTLGVISGLSRDIEGATGTEAAALSHLIQTDAPISPGNSGGALADSNAVVIGINVAYEPPAQTGAVSIGFAIPAATATSVADQIIAGGVGNGNGGSSTDAPQAYLGIGPVDVTPMLQQQYGLSQSSGVLVAQVSQGSPAEAAGLQQGDIIIGADGQAVRSSADLFAIDQNKRPGDQVELTIDRSGRQGTLSVTLGERPASAQ